MDGPVEPRPAPRLRCPRCGRPSVERFRPFCSATCRDRDLLDWLDGRYALPAVESEDEEAAEPSEAGPSRGTASGED
jgi:endogenous inhibitor of DNA gyrase (YacG/DUF329 family)